ncbi:hypothetical protein [Chryseobacterium sp. Leaf201]|uniref:hypothetical protein n=1 Tax=Chryseobacterium sp. Leaf201 TaxID=1735672 RepID=UPI00070043CB|nr:hypothetical protein [Chryseobacterium sp. Leaf201]KQM27570.1 hypothetical protein ASE55_17405 [Chryseobacterium sp. Leaf201]
MKTIKDFQEENGLNLEKETMGNIIGGKLPEGGSTRREDLCTGAHGGDSEVSYWSDSGTLISLDGTTEEGGTYHYP